MMFENSHARCSQRHYLGPSVGAGAHGLRVSPVRFQFKLKPETRMSNIFSRVSPLWNPPNEDTR